MLKVKNIDSVSHTWGGKEYSASELYSLSESESFLVSSDQLFISDYYSNLAEVYDGDSKISDRAVALDWLRGRSVEISSTPPFSSASGYRFRGKGISGTATAGETTNIEYRLSEERYINGVQVVVTDGHHDDTCNFEVVDVDNILGYGAGFVADRFAEDWRMASDLENQGTIILPYPAKIIAGLYLRFAYTSHGTSNVALRINLFLHKQTT